MNDKQPYQFEPEEPLQDEDDSDCFKESRIIEESARRTRNTTIAPAAISGDTRDSNFSWLTNGYATSK